MVTYRKIASQDNVAMASIIRRSLEEFGANKVGTVYYDDSTDQLSDLFLLEGSHYIVAEEDGVLLGGGGIYPSKGLPEGTVELVKMYLSPHARGKGIGLYLIQQNIDMARNLGYKRVYIESMPELKRAISIYERFGFQYISGPQGQTGHHGCDVWMELVL